MGYCRPIEMPAMAASSGPLVNILGGWGSTQLDVTRRLASVEEGESKLATHRAVLGC